MAQKRVVVTVKGGKVRGIQQKSAFSGAEYYSFFGVPYGQSTAGLSRFKDPVKARPWKDILDATSEQKEGCLQFASLLRRFAGSEDCLYNNIHTPRIPRKHESLKPVIATIHGGGLFHGSPETWCYGSPEYIMDKDIVYVCIAYRLHMLGFLNLGLKDCSGNQGMKDIILSLQWVKENISAFGGDPNNVTLLGTSSGAALAHYLMLSPAAKGLFHKAVLMGMYGFNPTLNTHIEHKKEAYKCATALRYQKTEGNDEKKLLSHLKNLLIHHFIRLRVEFSMFKESALLFPASLFSETVDTGKNPVLPVSPEKLIDSTARIPVMFGICKQEAILGFGSSCLEGTMSNFYSTYRQNEWGWGRNITDEEVELIKDQVNDFYLNGDSLKNAPFQLKVDIQSDIAFSSVYDTFLDVVARDLPASVFVYRFEFNGNAITVRDGILSDLEEPLEGPYHGADYSYWNHFTEKSSYFKNRNGTHSLSSESRRMVTTMTKLISTFARTGNPNHEGLQVEWKPTTTENPCYLNIDETLEMVDGKLNGKRMEFWENIQKQFKKD